MSSPLRQNITTMVKSSATSVSGLMRGMNSRSIPVVALRPDQHEAGEHAGEEGDAQVDEHALRRSRRW